jgi:quercetin dioxygenase-like cupin family protein
VSPPAGYMLGPGEGVPGEGDADLKASRVSTSGVLTVIESDTSGGAPRHEHGHEDECFYVLEGVISVECGDDTWEAGAGSFVFLPRGVPHAWDVVGDRARVLIITAPAGLEEFLREFHEAADGERGEVARRHGIEFLAP